jgi:hypothetical protein
MAKDEEEEDGESEKEVLLGNLLTSDANTLNRVEDDIGEKGKYRILIRLQDRYGELEGTVHEHDELRAIFS